MSIPPLVCNTPPPIDQCDDDKDQEDFDLRYNLSQEDDDSNDFDYSGFCPYSNFQTNEQQHKEDFPKISYSTAEPDVAIPSTHENNVEPESEFKKYNCKMKLQDEVNLEDLDLKLDRVSIGSDKENQGEKNHNSSPDKESSADISTASNTDSDEAKQNVESESSLEEDPISRNENCEPTYITEDAVLPKGLQQKDLELENSQTGIFDITPETFKPEEPQVLENDDEFGDFDDFKFASTESVTTPITDKEIENPWCGQECTDDNQDIQFEAFGDFTTAEESNKVAETESTEQPKEDDDFGDFDEFQSTTVQEDVDPDDPVLDLLPTISDQAIEKVIFSIFEKDDSDTDSKFETKLESFLSETWRHLKETDLRQPYLVNWNSSIAQKTLLKALCIDSRNILFGPKWAHNMPRYAVNLGAAPLQPQKQISMQSEAANPDKSSSQPADSSANTFTSSAGQECWSFCDLKPSTDGETVHEESRELLKCHAFEVTYAEALLLDLEQLMATLDQMAHNHAGLKIADLLSHRACDHEESPAEPPRAPPAAACPAPVPAKPEIYSATLNIQPIRQISLPDTHIFTPTDSQIPRSKTIHYDNSPTIILPERKPKEQENDFSDFQDFREVSNNRQKSETKDSKDEVSAASSVLTPKQLHILEPIKIEPIVPKLNWPDPGQVKETFEDFSDFISNTSWGNNNVNSPENSSSNVDLSSLSVATSSKKDTNITQSDFDDGFESFQSAIPTVKSTRAESPASGINHTTAAPAAHQSPINHTVIDSVFAMSERNSTKSNNISPLKPPTTLPQNVTFNNPVSPKNTTEIKSKPMVPISPSFTSQILQPISTGLSATQPKPSTTQILQPLSLEGYINWPDPGLDLQDLSRFNPVEKLPSLKGETSGGGSLSKTASPAHARKASPAQPPPAAAALDDDGWGEFVSSRPSGPVSVPAKQAFVDDDEWTDFVSSSNVKPPNGVNTISFNVHTSSSFQKSSISNKYNSLATSKKPTMDIPTLNYITPKTGNPKAYADGHFQNL